MSKWLAAELHVHTKHSDGQNSLMEMAQAAKANGISVIALTDHNTISAHREIAEVYESTGVYIIPGIEQTSFYGHVLNLNVRDYIDWRNLNRHNLSGLLEEVRAKGGVSGLAHPFRLGGVLCTGCKFIYEVDFEKIDYIEIWSREFPSVTAYENRPTFDFWDHILNQGYKITGLSGRDWHRISAREEAPISRTFINFDRTITIDNIGTLAAEAIKNGNVSVSMAHCVVLSCEKNIAAVSIDDIGLEEYWRAFNVSDTKIVLVSNLGVMHEEAISKDNVVTYPLEPAIKWLRAELYGIIADNETLIGFSNPIYI